MTIFEKLRNRGYDTVPESFYNQIAIWQSWYKGNVKGFHNYRVFNGQRKVDCTRYSMNMGKKVSEDWANLLMNEKVEITLEGEKEQAFIDRVLKENNFLVKANELQEIKAALGTGAYIVSPAGFAVNPDTGGITESAQRIRIDYCSAPNIIPLSWENGIVSECAFCVDKTIEGKKYIYMQLHRLEKSEYVIENIVYSTENDKLEEIDFAQLRGFENIPAVVRTGSPRRQFVIDRLNIVNSVDESLPMGIPAFASAIDQLKGVDVAYDSYVNEFVLGKKRIMVKPEATKGLDGESFFDPNDTVYYVLPEDAENGSMILPIDMTLRTAEHNAGMQDMLNALSSKCGFGENHYRYNSGSVSTATQVISENSTLYRTVKKHEIVLNEVLTELCEIILRLGNSAMRMGLNENAAVKIAFDDSIIEDKQQDFNRDLQLLNAGIMNDWEFRAKWMHEDTETAKQNLPGAETLTTEGQDEIE